MQELRLQLGRAQGASRDWSHRYEQAAADVQNIRGSYQQSEALAAKRLQAAEKALAEEVQQWKSEVAAACGRAEWADRMDLVACSTDESEIAPGILGLFMPTQLGL